MERLNFICLQGLGNFLKKNHKLLQKLKPKFSINQQSEKSPDQKTPT